MNARAWCLIGVRTAGAVMLFLSLPRVMSLPFQTFAQMQNAGAIFALQVLLEDTGFWTLAVGLYLFFGGKWVAKQITRGLAVPGMCPGCGYDVRDLESTRCPECGAKVR